ncbi:hypothetical protein [Spirosoma flavum]|uniref:Uncharacterized protein n=1 Tax=Spirosoma flavum TaxID=2048557 RepID=A0ABW6AR64_9BACT
MPTVEIIPDGRGGKIAYRSKRTSFTLEFEYTYQPETCYMIIFPPSPKQWTAITGLAESKQNSTISFIAKQIIQQVAPGYTYVEYRDFIEIVKEG